MYVYIHSEPNLWTVGFYRPDGAWEDESDHSTTEEAAKRVHYLNGGQDESVTTSIKDVYSKLQDLDARTVLRMPSVFRPEEDAINPDNK